jgi:hypothetical protein
MRTLSWFSFVTLIIYSFSLNSCKKDDPGNNINITGVVTVPGSQLGIALTGTIGPSGGTLITNDGKAEFVFPAGALNKATDITIQPITSNIPLAVGNAYRLLPENTQFINPVILKYHYSTDEMEGTFPEAIFIAHQNTDGIWQAHGNVITDTVNKTISAQLFHFSDWGLFSAYQMEISDEIVDPDEQVDLKIKEIPGASLFFSLGQQATVPIGSPVAPASGTDFQIDQTWSLPVNRGSITTSAGRSTYNAPSIFPTNSSFNLVRILGKITISPNKVYQMTQEVSLGGTVQVNVDGQAYFCNNGSFVLTLATGDNVLGALNQSLLCGLHLGWNGSGVGRFVSGGAASGNEFWFTTANKSYSPVYSICGPPDNKYLTTTVDVSSANKTSYVIRGTFNGTLSIENGETLCNSFYITKYKEVKLSGYFKVKWQRYDR